MHILPSLPVFAAYVVAVVALTLTPGPDMTLFLGKTVSQSRAAGLAAYAGASTGCLIHTVLVAVGLSALLAASVTAFTILKIVGAIYLLWLAVTALRHGSAFTTEGAARPTEPIGKVYLTGLGINLLNPKVIVFFVTFLPQFVSAGDPNAGVQLLFLGVVFVLVATPICIALILSADRIAAFLRRSRRATRAVDYLFAAVMGGFAVKLVLARI